MTKAVQVDTRWISVGQVARIIGVRPGYVRFLVDTGRLRAKRSSFGIRLVDKRAAERFAAERIRQQAARVPREAVAP